MSNDFPGPINADEASAAEQRRRALKNRFRSVSRQIDRGGSGMGGEFGDRLSAFELALIVGALAFALWAVAHMLGIG